jgi:hypothetical protein
MRASYVQRLVPYDHSTPLSKPHLGPNVPQKRDLSPMDQLVQQECRWGGRHLVFGPWDQWL